MKWRDSALITAAAIAAMAAGPLSGCRAPRDPDLEARVEAGAKWVAPAPAAAEATKTSEATGVPMKGSVERRTYTNAEQAAILGAVPGEGPTLAMDLVTAKGNIRCVLDAEAAPQTVTNIVALGLGKRPWRDPDTGKVAKGKFYDGLTFHRAIDGFIAQTGNPGAARSGGPGWTVAREDGIPDAFKTAGALAMVDAGEDTHGSQFFIVVKASTSLAGRYTPFGRCENLDIAKAITAGAKHPAAEGKKSATRPVEPVALERMSFSRR